MSDQHNLLTDMPSEFLLSTVYSYLSDYRDLLRLASVSTKVAHTLREHSGGCSLCGARPDSRCFFGSFPEWRAQLRLLHGAVGRTIVRQEKFADGSGALALRLFLDDGSCLQLDASCAASNHAALAKMRESGDGSTAFTGHVVVKSGPTAHGPEVLVGQTIVGARTECVQNSGTAITRGSCRLNAVETGKALVLTLSRPSGRAGENDQAAGARPVAEGPKTRANRHHVRNLFASGAFDDVCEDPTKALSGRFHASKPSLGQMAVAHSASFGAWDMSSSSVGASQPSDRARKLDRDAPSVASTTTGSVFSVQVFWLATHDDGSMSGPFYGAHDYQLLTGDAVPPPGACQESPVRSPGSPLCFGSASPRRYLGAARSPTATLRPSSPGLAAALLTRGSGDLDRIDGFSPSRKTPSPSKLQLLDGFLAPPRLLPTANADYHNSVSSSL